MANIQPTLGNVLFVGFTAVIFVAGGMATVHYLAPKTIPILSPTARGVSDFLTKAVAS
jgi:hypothetical protein